ncbi:PadR family transcriptional regulator [Eubacterium ramulus]
MAKKALETLTESMFYVLMAFSQGEKCGVEITDFIRELTKGRVHLGPATLYTILGKFEQEKLIHETAVEGRKRTYALTEKGLQIYQAEVLRLTQCLADAKSLIK